MPPFICHVLIAVLLNDILKGKEKVYENIFIRVDFIKDLKLAGC